MLKISATFLDEISWDIPHQNWTAAKWDQDFAAMKKAGINTVVMIRSGLARWTAWPCRYLHEQCGTAMPETDLPDLFLTLAEKYEMRFFLGLYHSRYYSSNNQWDKEIKLNMGVAKEAWERYGHRKAFQGWYLCHEISVNSGNIIGLYSSLGKYCKAISGNLPVMISPFVKGIKEGNEWNPELATGRASITPENHEKEWRNILQALQGAVDIVAFQDGHVDIFELQNYLEINRRIIEEFGMECWTNCETFDRDMPIRFLPIKWEKMLYKLKAAEAVGITKAITFEFSHFMSPNSIYAGAHGLYECYLDYINNPKK